MKILVSGSTGLVGSALLPSLVTEGHTPTRLVRSFNKQATLSIGWDPSSSALHPAPFEGFGAVIHLAGESIATGRWTDAKKTRIRDSRVKGTRLLSETLAKLQQRPKVLICASAIGFYGDRGEERLTESSRMGSNFLARLCRDWEAATEPAVQGGIRVVHLRFGIILSPKGGALTKMLLPFKLGLGGKIGSGAQVMSWIALDDVVGVILHALKTGSLKGPVNTVAPQPVTNSEFTQTLGKVLHRPTIFPLPALVAKLAFGEMADELLLSSARVDPTALKTSGYAFNYPELEGALRHLLEK